VTVTVNNVSYNGYSVANLGEGSWNLTSSGSTNVEYARIQSASGSVPPSGLSIVSGTSGGVLINEIGLPASAPVASGRIYAEIGNSVKTGIALVNPGTQATVISYYFTTAGGSKLSSSSFTLPANQQVVAFLNQQPFNGPNNIQGTFTFTSSPVAVSAVGYIGSTNSRGEFIETTLPVFPLVQKYGSQELLFPHFVGSGGWTSEMVLVNPTDVTLSGTFQLFSQPAQSGGTSSISLTIGNVTASTFQYSIPAHGQYQMSTSATRLGWIQITPASNTAAPGAFSLLSYVNAQGITVSKTAIEAPHASTAYRMYVEASGASGQTGSIRTALAVFNPSTSSVTVQLVAYNPNGTPTGLSTSLSIPPNGAVTQFVDQLLTQLPIPFRGVLRLSSTVPIMANVLHSRWNQRGDFLTSDTPPSNETIVPSGSETDLAYVVAGGGYSTQIVIFPGSSGSGVTGTLLLVNSNGTTPQNQNLQPQ
jgi:hypothetical protein